MAHDQWTEVEWIVALAKTYDDTLDPTGREDEMAYLRERVATKLSALEDNRPDALVNLATALGVESQEATPTDQGSE